MFIQSRPNAFFVVIFLSIIVIFLYSLGLLHFLACSSQNPTLFSVLGFIESVLGISYPLGTRVISTYMPLTNCSF
ncbi:MAG: hypothetical protein PHE48_02770 [Candidatus Daviesbacteria bacterium]|nr:hypothetical protein [Candidatus Daviesbacteria bacterium]